ncbi:hypothetical protein AMECASPLE_034032, partial [Ameca splendens]
LYENFVEEVDAVDNGISQYDGEARYAVSSTLSARVAHLNPRWNSKSQDTEDSTQERSSVSHQTIHKTSKKRFCFFSIVNIWRMFIIIVFVYTLRTAQKRTKNSGKVWKFVLKNILEP